MNYLAINRRIKTESRCFRNDEPPEYYEGPEDDEDYDGEESDGEDQPILGEG